jgi:transposase
MGRVVTGMDPHKRSATIEIINEREKVLAKGRFGTDRDGYQAMLKLGRQHKDRAWAVEGCNGIGRHIAQRLVADGRGDSPDGRFGRTVTGRGASWQAGGS